MRFCVSPVASGDVAGGAGGGGSTGCGGGTTGGGIGGISFGTGSIRFGEFDDFDELECKLEFGFGFGLADFNFAIARRSRSTVFRRSTSPPAPRNAVFFFTIGDSSLLLEWSLRLELEK